MILDKYRDQVKQKKAEEALEASRIASSHPDDNAPNDHLKQWIQRTVLSGGFELSADRDTWVNELRALADSKLFTQDDMVELCDSGDESENKRQVKHAIKHCKDNPQNIKPLMALLKKGGFMYADEFKNKTENIVRPIQWRSTGVAAPIQAHDEQEAELKKIWDESSKQQGRQPHQDSIAPVDFTENLPNLELLASPFVVEGQRLMLYGTGGNGKTTLVRSMLVHAALALDFFNQPTQGCIPVLWGEEGTDDLIRHVRSMPDKRLRQAQMYCYRHDECSLDQLSANVKTIKSQHPDKKIVLVFDPIGYAVAQEGGSMNNNTDVIKVLTKIFKIGEGCTVIAIHHAKKPSKETSTDDPDSFQGSAYFKNLFDIVIRMTKAEDTTDLTIEKARTSSRHAIGIAKAWSYKLVDECIVVCESTQLALPTAKELIIRQLKIGEHKTRDSLYKAVGGNRNERAAVFRRMEADTEASHINGTWQYTPKQLH